LRIARSRIVTNVPPAGGTFFFAARDYACGGAWSNTLDGRPCSTSHANICSMLGERDGPYTANRTIAQVDILGIASAGRVISISKSIRCPLRSISLI